MKITHIVPTIALALLMSVSHNTVVNAVEVELGVPSTTTAKPPVERAFDREETRSSNAAKREEVKSSLEAKKMEVKSKGAELRKEAGYKAIDKRITSLNKLSTKIDAMKKLSSSSKDSLKAKINAEVNALGVLKSSLATETDATKVKELKQSITKSFRVYALFEPQIRILAAADRILQVVEATKAKTTDAAIIAKLDVAAKSAQSAIDTVLPLTPEGYPANKSTLQAAGANIKGALESLRSLKMEKMEKAMEGKTGAKVKSPIEPESAQ
jgi:hypothetical protein